MQAPGSRSRVSRGEDLPCEGSSFHGHDSTLFRFLYSVGDSPQYCLNTRLK